MARGGASDVTPTLGRGSAVTTPQLGGGAGAAQCHHDQVTGPGPPDTAAVGCHTPTRQEPPAAAVIRVREWSRDPRPEPSGAEDIGVMRGVGGQ